MSTTLSRGISTPRVSTRLPSPPTKTSVPDGEIALRDQGGEDTHDRAPDERRPDHGEREVLEHVDVEHVEHDEGRDEDGGGDQRDRVEPGQPEHEHRPQPEGQAGAERRHRGLRQLREDRRDDCRAQHTLIGRRGERPAHAGQGRRVDVQDP